MSKRVLKYSQAINEAFHEEMAADARVVQIGVGINTPWYVGQTLHELLDRFGEDRMIDTPVSENGVAGMAIGAAMTGMRPVLTFPRMDFMYYAMDQLCNQCAMVSYSLGGNRPIPITVRAIINRGGEQGAQHSQALQSLFMHVPGFKVVMPARPEDAKGMLIAAIRDPNPVIYIEDRWLYDEEGVVPEGDFTTSLSGARVVAAGSDMTVVSSSYLVAETERALPALTEAGIAAELDRPEGPQADRRGDRPGVCSQDRQAGYSRRHVEDRRRGRGNQCCDRRGGFRRSLGADRTNRPTRFSSPRKRSVGARVLPHTSRDRCANSGGGRRM